jgi:hypothetical protein
MKVKDLKKYLETLPEDATAYFTIWTDNGAKNYWFNPLLDGENISKNKQYARIAWTDDCRAYLLSDEQVY